MRPMPSIVDVMTPFPYTVERAESLKTAVSIMYGKGIRHLPVVDGPKLVGILTDRDAKLALAVSKGIKDENSIRVEDVCIFEPYVVRSTEKLDKVLEHMVKEHIGSALVIKDGKVVGIFTVTDACRKLSELLRVHYPDA